jgi:uncharacterized protein (DUF1697 family)
MSAMKTYIVLLRGVTPVGKNKVPMAQLREVLSNDGFDRVRTYIQSGNALVDTELPASRIGKRVHELIEKHIGPDLVVVVRTRTEMQNMLYGNPFQKDHDISRVFFVLFAQKPSVDRVAELLTRDFGNEKLAIAKNAAYMYIPGTYGRGKLSNNYLEKQLGISATMRNFNTISKLIELSK